MWKFLDFFANLSFLLLLSFSLVLSLETFLQPFRDGIFMFTGGRCGDRISPAFGSVVNGLVILGHVGGFGNYIPAHCFHTHSLSLDPTKGVTSGIKTFMTASPQGQEWPNNETHTDHYGNI